MTVIELAKVSIRDVPVVLWKRFVGSCVTDNKKVSEGIIEAINLYLEKRED
jgi:hypothetical protein